MHKVVVTGGLGFIGSHVVDALLADGRDVSIVDSMVAAVTDGNEFETLRAPPSIASRSPTTSPPAASPARTWSSTPPSPVGPAGILRQQGVLGAEIVSTTQRVIDECVEHDVALVTFSSAEVYGRSGLLAESDDIDRPDALQRPARVRDRQDADRGDRRSTAASAACAAS